MDQKQQIADKIKQANNILVTVSNNPSVDQLAACMGLTLTLNKLGKHATAVFSGAVPSTIEFLQPDKTLEHNTDSLRDFIISLDKAKADKLRYKVEDKVVKIFITPYRTSIGEHDLEFSQGDFNVDVVLALGVHSPQELDQAITAHGRILHDATVATINVKPGGNLGSMNWLVPGASSLCELGVDLVNALDKQLIDGQVATAFLTGIVSETKRFSNERTSPDTMSISAQLMSAGANPQLVATKLEPPAPPPPPPAPPEAKEPPRQEKHPEPEQKKASEDGTLEISHSDKPEPKPEKPPEEDNKPLNSLDDLYADDEEARKAPLPTPKIQIDEQGALRNIEEIQDKPEEAEKKPAESTTDPTQHLGGSRMILQPPSGGVPAEPGVETGLDNFGGPQAESASGSPSLATPVASATIAPPNTPFMPASMTPPAADLPPQPPADLTAPAPPAAPALPTNPFAPPFGPATAPAGTLDVPPAPAPLPPAPGDAITSAIPGLAPPAPAPTGNTGDALSQSFVAQLSDRPEPIKALNAQPLGDPLHIPPPPPPAAPGNIPPDLNVPVPAEGPAPAPNLNIPTPVGAPPPGPPPMLPPPQ